METIKYILDFFFGPGCGWHFIGLCFICFCLSGSKYTNINIIEKKKED